MIRPSWEGSEQQKELLSETVAAFQEARRVAQEAENAAWAKAQQARAAGVPDTVICNRAEVTRSTLNRKLGPRPER
ncbi:hypothetical protein AB0M02_00540 [Actinoplanes sp. NPDC051861]|uniref:hypothetical protein n=1 Tax=Actinoplanes sp. NPDC051861 TaxID=3155170 RepID=UPI0034182172